MHWCEGRRRQISHDGAVRPNNAVAVYEALVEALLSHRNNSA